ncbi:MAG: tetratricopeptide repeat protein, partial [Geobacter sp.]
MSALFEDMLQKGDALLESGEFKKAIECFEQCVKSRPEEPEAFFKLGYAMAEAGILEGALKSYSEGL